MSSSTQSSDWSMLSSDHRQTEPQVIWRLETETCSAAEFRELSHSQFSLNLEIFSLKCDNVNTFSLPETSTRNSDCFSPDLSWIRTSGSESQKNCWIQFQCFSETETDRWRRFLTVSITADTQPINSLHSCDVICDVTAECHVPAGTVSVWWTRDTVMLQVQISAVFYQHHTDTFRDGDSMELG